MPVINKISLKDKLRELVDMHGLLKIHFVLGYMKCYSTMVNKNVKEYDIQYSANSNYVKDIKIKYKNGDEEKISLKI